MDKSIYAAAKKIADDTYKVPSAYKSIFLTKKYKELGGRIKPGSKSGTKQWIREGWKNLTPVARGNATVKTAPPCGKKGPKQGKLPSICRPTKKVSKNTPVLAGNYTQAQLRKALGIKKKGGRIDWSEL